ncbi:MAG: tRNA (guanosine(37)-N1)-methyltransferase TrmD [Coriobacteriales bacterium]|jgi:tRNA (guanine37-N1)-methyltransferase|nr:tRNA (guanosine(37)-N1)-methyltransferase TrmD [Coriobacteriales bacterium]
MRIETVSVFPQMFDVPMSLSIIGRAREKGLLSFAAHDLRDWTGDRHRTVDDEPYGGGQGQLMMVQPVFEALDDLLAHEPATVVFFTPAGEPFSHAIATELSKQSRLVLVCGRYEGFDERVYTRADRCISLGDYVLTGGELAAMVVTDAICRLLPGVLGDELSNVEESFADGLLEFPQYTRPSVYRDLAVPSILLSGDHQKIAEWRRKQSILKTAQIRPDLLERASLSNDEWSIARAALKDYNGRA